MQHLQAMRYLPLKKAALLALEQSVQQPGQLSEQQQQHQQQEIKGLNVAEVDAQLLDARWSTEQLAMASDTAKQAAADITDAKKRAKHSRQQQQR